MPSTERFLRLLLAFQGALYIAANVWALIATDHYLSLIHPAGSLLETRELAALSSVMAVFFLAGAWRKDLLKPASFLGLGAALALTVVQLFHLPSVGLTWLLGDFVLELAMAALYIGLIFFQREFEAPKHTAASDEAPPSSMTVSSHDETSADAAVPPLAASEGASSSSDGSSAD